MSSATGSTAQVTFDTFWAAYPRKVGKLPSYQVWSKLLKAGTKPEAIMAGLRGYMADKPDWQHWCHPVTFLRQQRFADFEPIRQVPQDMPLGGPRIVQDCVLPPDLPDTAVPLSKSMYEVVWLIPGGGRVTRPRWPGNDKGLSSQSHRAP